MLRGILRMLGGTACLAVFTSLPTSMLYKLTETQYFTANSYEDAARTAEEFDRLVGFGNERRLVAVPWWERVYVWWRDIPLGMWKW